jgi:dethiobiotin synthetase
MKQGFFVTGTDTNVGKTVVSAALMCALRGEHNVCYWKPVQTGIETDDDTREVNRLANCQESEIYNAGYRLEKPLSPHLSARLANVRIEISNLLEIWNNAPDNRFWIIEGAGGVFVPLNETELIIDLMAKLNLPVIIAARSGLGTINHTLLTLEALRNRNLQVFGVIMNGEPNLENKKAIEHYGRVKVIGELPHLEKLNFETLQEQSFFI